MDTGELRNSLTREKASSDAIVASHFPDTEAHPILPSNALSPEDTVKYLHLKNQQMQRQHEQEIANMNLAMLKVRESLEQDKRRTLAEFWRQADIEKQKAITQIKKNCVDCGKTTKTKTILTSVPSFPSVSTSSAVSSKPLVSPSFKTMTPVTSLNSLPSTLPTITWPWRVWGPGRGGGDHHYSPSQTGRKTHVKTKKHLILGSRDSTFVAR